MDTPLTQSFGFRGDVVAESVCELSDQVKTEYEMSQNNIWFVYQSSCQGESTDGTFLAQFMATNVRARHLTP